MKVISPVFFPSTEIGARIELILSHSLSRSRLGPDFWAGGVVGGGVVVGVMVGGDLLETDADDLAAPVAVPVQAISSDFGAAAACCSASALAFATFASKAANSVSYCARR